MSKMPWAGPRVLALRLLCLCALSPGVSQAVETGVVTGWLYTGEKTVQQLGPRQLDDLKNIGATHIRVEFIYPDSEPERNTYITAYKNIVQWAGERGIRVIGVLTVNSMLNKSVKPVNTSGPQDFDNRFVPIFKEALDWHDTAYATVNGTSYGVEAWELWNEPDVYDMRRNDGHFMAEEFALLCVRAYEHYKGRGGTRKLIMGALSRWDDDDLFRQVYDSSPVRNFKAAQGRNVLPGDAIGMHAYGNLNKLPSQKGFSYASGNFEDVILNIRTLRDSAGRELVPSGQPIYVTEAGFGSNRSDDGSQVYYWRQATQAAELRYVLETLNRYPQFQRVYWYALRDEENKDSADPRGRNWNGLRHVPQAHCGLGATKLSYNVFANFNGRPGPAQRAAWQVLPAGDESWPTGWVTPPACGALQSPDPLLRAFHRHDQARNLVGQPRNLGGGPYVHRWGNGQVQHFINGVWEGGLGALGLADGRSEAGYVYGRFYEKWMAIGFTHVGGFPVDKGGGADRHRWDSSISRGMVQDFDGGSLGPGMLQLEEWPVAGAQVLIVQGAWYQHYMANGGVGVFGYARTEPYYLGGTQYRMDFARGYMIHDTTTNAVTHSF